jgi:hypothetical protein
MHKHVSAVTLLVLACLLAGCRDRNDPTKPTVAGPDLARLAQAA